MSTENNRLVKIAIVDDHSIFRSGSRMIIESIKDTYQLSVVFDAENGRDFISKISSCSDKIDLVILDYKMPVMDGFETLQWIKKNHPEIRVLILSFYNESSIVASFLMEGAVGYLTKNMPAEKLIEAIKSVIEKGLYIDEFILTSLITVLKQINYAPQDFFKGEAVLATNVLTDREREFLQLLGTDLSYKEIAQKMHISPRTVDGFREALFRKLNVNTRVALVLYGVRNGIINP